MNRLAKLLRLDKRMERMEFRLRADRLTYLAMTSTAPGTAERAIPDGPELIVSLTSYGPRMADVALTVESLMQQTLKPDRIILWVAEADKDLVTLPLLNQTTRGLEIETTRDIRSYKKLVPALERYPGAVIITVDDDVIYNPDMVERLVMSWRKNPDMIHALRVHRMTLDKDGRPLPYRKWDRSTPVTGPSMLNVAVGVGGVLYPPGCLDKEATREDRFMSLSPTADDLWFKAMSLRRGTPVVKVPTASVDSEDYTNNPDARSSALMDTNLKGGNDRQMRALFDAYNLQEYLKNQKGESRKS